MFINKIFNTFWMRLGEVAGKLKMAHMYLNGNNNTQPSTNKSPFEFVFILPSYERDHGDH